MILHFSHIGFTEALTFIAPVFVSTTGLPLAPGVGQAGTNFGPVGRPRKIAGACFGGCPAGRAGVPPSKRAAGASLECFEGGTPALLPTRPEARASKAPGRPASPRKLSELRPTRPDAPGRAGAHDRSVSLPELDLGHAGVPSWVAGGPPKNTQARLLPSVFGRGTRHPSRYRRYSSSCQGVRIRGPSAVTATVNSKWAASEPSWE